MNRIKRGLLVAMAALTVAVFASSTVASAAPAKNCQNNPENFQVVNGQCVSDGQAQKLP